MVYAFPARRLVLTAGIALAATVALVYWAAIISVPLHEGTDDNTKSEVELLQANYNADISSELVRLESLGREKCDNPYTRPGYLYAANEHDFKGTKWVPFYSGMLDRSQSDRAVYPRPPVRDPYSEHETFPDGPPPDSEFGMTPHSWMRDLKDLSDLKRRDEDGKVQLTEQQKQYKAVLEDRLYWVRDRRILLIADSVDRYMAIYMCNKLNGQFELGPAGFQTTAFCVIDHMNITITHWHVSSTYTSLPPWWWMKSTKTKYVAIEERWQEYYLPTVNQTIGKNGRSPDLVILQSGLWDQTMFAYAHNQLLLDQGKTKQFADKLDFMRPLNWEELNFYMHRISKFIGLIREQFGRDVPLVYRSMTHKSNGSETMGIHDLERAARFVCKELDVEYMEFGSLVAGHYDWYRDQVHLEDGPLSALWGNIVMWYLFRTQGGNEFKGAIQRMPPKGSFGSQTHDLTIAEAWKECHDVFMHRSLV
ncbi:hypothetical protein POJ06DRAFT_123093 [Lipomyces tetrasporus]|uniref:Uncharacterized protein n=1 Tax=Lipomyces tetrasporus TaxID=54092 RepID=A0AAD7QR97_9ASCO|nr:uncharacterized protein POJ06DRAFT_123093 [Lipomyces tetrasporus]KAJ8100069.1 hypothetical protein POJ06DRAFT_123093 [Lipomyces tetrasporus]